MMNRLTRLCPFTAFLLLLMAAANPARADFTVYSNFGPGNGGQDYNTGTGWTVGNDFSGDDYAVGDSFTAQAGTLSTITLALEFSAGPNAATVSLCSDAGGVPDGVLESWTVSNLPPLDGSFHTPLTVTDSTNTVLQAGTTYWVVVSTSATSSLAWNWNNTGAVVNHAEAPDGATWFASPDTQGAFSVTESGGQNPTAPEPSTLTLLTLGVGALAGYGLRRRLPIPAFLR